MILTADEIARAQEAGDLSVEPFSTTHINPNSYNFHLDARLICLSPQVNGPPLRTDQSIPDEGLLLEPRKLYLGTTLEFIASRKYVITLLGRSSIGRLGVFLNATADLGHVGSRSKWTLEISVVQPVRIYRYMKIGQIAFWAVAGATNPYEGRYLGDVEPEPNKDRHLQLALMREKTR